MILTGSSALLHHFPDFHRVPKDRDYIGVGKNIPGKIEYHVNPIFDDYPYEIMQPDDVYTLKISHLFWDIKWSKHMFDVQFLKKKGCIFKRDLFDKLYQHWSSVHGTNHRSDLNMSAKDFFNNALKTYDHDGLHYLLTRVPTFTKVLKNNAEVDVDENKFYNLTYQEKCDLVREEVYVMAFERLHGRSYREAYSWMLKKFIMNHAPMFEALFIIDNYIELHKPKFDYVKFLNEKLNESPQPKKTQNDVQK